jgi:hypothetical protein
MVCLYESAKGWDGGWAWVIQAPASASLAGLWQGLPISTDATAKATDPVIVTTAESLMDDYQVRVVGSPQSWTKVRWKFGAKRFTAYILQTSQAQYIEIVENALEMNRGIRSDLQEKARRGVRPRG